MIDADHGCGEAGHCSSEPASDFEQLGGQLVILDTPTTALVQNVLSEMVGGGVDQTIMRARSKSADDYGRVIALLNPRWRVIECRHRLQWILQHRGSPEKPRRDDWRGRSYCRNIRSFAPLCARARWHH